MGFQEPRRAWGDLSEALHKAPQVCGPPLFRRRPGPKHGETNAAAENPLYEGLWISAPAEGEDDTRWDLLLGLEEGDQVLPRGTPFIGAPEENRVTVLMVASSS